MVLTLERLGNGAAYLVHDQVTSTTILLGSGEVKAHPLQSPSLLTPRGVALDYDSGNESGESGYGGDEVGARQYARDLKHLMQRENEQALNAIFITDYRPESCFMLPYITEKCPIPPQQPPPAIYLTHSTRAIGPHMLTEYWLNAIQVHVMNIYHTDYLYLIGLDIMDKSKIQIKYLMTYKISPIPFIVQHLYL
jgi:hypothetical protein